MNIVLKLYNKQRQIYRNSSTPYNILYVYACTMPSAKKGQQKVPRVKKTTGPGPSSSYRPGTNLGIRQLETFPVASTGTL